MVNVLEDTLPRSLQTPLSVTAEVTGVRGVMQAIEKNAVL